MKKIKFCTITIAIVILTIYGVCYAQKFEAEKGLEKVPNSQVFVDVTADLTKLGIADTNALGDGSPQQKLFSFGVIADVQWGDKENRGAMH